MLRFFWHFSEQWNSLQFCKLFCVSSAAVKGGTHGCTDRWEEFRVGRHTLRRAPLWDRILIYDTVAKAGEEEAPMETSHWGDWEPKKKTLSYWKNLLSQVTQSTHRASHHITSHKRLWGRLRFIWPHNVIPTHTTGLINMYGFRVFCMLSLLNQEVESDRESNKKYRELSNRHRYTATTQNLRICLIQRSRFKSKQVVLHLK